MITEDRLHHTLRVARKAYKIAKDLGEDEKYARQMFALGWNYDIGYEFDPYIHEQIGPKMLPGYRYNKEIKQHGKIPTEITKEWLILNMADMTTSPNGKEVTLDERLKEIESRYSKEHIWYIESKEVCNILKQHFKEMS